MERLHRGILRHSIHAPKTDPALLTPVAACGIVTDHDSEPMLPSQRLDGVDSLREA